MSSSTVDIWAAPCPFMSRSCIASPEVRPRPGIAGGLRAKITASCMAAHSSLKRFITASTVCDFPFRSLHGFRTTNIVPRLLPAPPAIKENPDISITSATSGIDSRMSEACVTTLSVRSSDAPVGSCTEVRKYPMSSSGT